MSAVPASVADRHRVAVVGGGPAGLMAAEVLALGGCRVDLFDAMPSVGRKFLLAGKGGLNITHAEPAAQFETRFGLASAWLKPLLAGFSPLQLREWVHALGVETFVGTSGRVFPAEMKAAPLLRAWLHRLRGQGVRFHMRHRWTGFGEAAAGADDPDDAIPLAFDSPAGPSHHRFDAVVLALGGASWPRLGSDGQWWPLLAARSVPLAPLLPANCGFDVGWSEHISGRFAGAAVKSVSLALAPDAPGRLGEFVITASGIEGSLIYTVAPTLRDRIASTGSAMLFLDLIPDRSLERIKADLALPRAGRSWSNHLRVRLGLAGVKAALLRECAPPGSFDEIARLALAIKQLPLVVQACRPIAEAISSAGGVKREGLDHALMLQQLPGVFCAGEMLDWEAPTGGYLLTASLASGRGAAAGVLARLAERHSAIMGGAPPGDPNPDHSTLSAMR